MPFWHQIAKQVQVDQATSEVEQIAKHLKDYVHAMRETTDLEDTDLDTALSLLLVRAMVAAVVKNGCDREEIVASLRSLADEVKAKAL